MDISGSHRIPASRAAVWAALRDEEVLKACIPGCERLDKRSEEAFEGAVAAKVGPIRALFQGHVTVSDAVEPERFRLAVEGADDKAGSGRGHADVTLVEEDGGTVVSYAGGAEAEGKVGQLGARLLTGVARIGIETFFARLADAAAEGRLSGAAAGTRPSPAEFPGRPFPAEAPMGERALGETSAMEPPAPGAPEPRPDVTPIAPTGVPDVPDPAAIAAAEAVEPSSGSVTRIMLVAAIVVVVAVAVYFFMLQPPA